MKSLFLLYSMFFVSILASAQQGIPKNKIPVHQGNFFAWVEVYDGEIKTRRIENDRTYYWIKAKQIHTSKGGYHGELLHGEYTALYKTDALKEKGMYVKGLKTGEWKEWHPNGELKCISHWKSGRQSGLITHYNEKGEITRKEKYKHGVLHGRQTYLTDTSETSIRYRNGKPVIKKPKTKKQKVEIEKGYEVEPNKDPTASDSSNTKRTRAWFGKKKNEKPDSAASTPMEKKENTKSNKKEEIKKNKGKKTKDSSTGKKETPDKKNE